MPFKSCFNDIYRGQKVLVFGHTGFKGSWLTLWLSELGADITGASLGIPTQPSHFEAGGFAECCDHRILDIRDLHGVATLIDEIQPDFVFHLAAQALVGLSYDDPVMTFQTNTIGTMNILEGLRYLKKPCSVVIITSDKCYENVETYYGYRETDAMGGKDPYSGSKGAAEIVLHSYTHSFFKQGSSVRIVSARAGNVIGGGDWATGRLVPDIVRAWSAKDIVDIRRPQATRPWLHVLEPLSGYLLLGAELAQKQSLHAESFNFGPKAEAVYPVSDVVSDLREHLINLQVNLATPGSELQGFHEAGLLKLVCDKALHFLDWRSVLDFHETMHMTAEWYRHFYEDGPGSIAEYSRTQLNQYIDKAKRRKLNWAQN